MSLIKTVRGFQPKIGSEVFLAENCVVIGDVQIGEKSSIWYNVTLRGDVMPIRIGRAVNIQDGTVVHGTFGEFGVEIADRVTIGHQVTLHGCQIGFESLIGMGSQILDGAVIPEQCLVGAGSLVTGALMTRTLKETGAQIPPRSLILGRPAKVVRPLTAEEIAALSQSAENYLLYKTWY